MSLPNVLIIGSGEYVSGIVSSDGAASSSDKSKGVVALVMFDLRSRKKIGNRIAIAGTCGLKFPHIRQHFATNIAGAYRDMDVTFESFPADDVARKTDSYKDAIATFSPGDLAIIFTPDDSHFDIAKACIDHGMHVCVTKPLVQTLQQHRALAELALERRVLSYVEVHKRWDPIYIDARARLRSFGDFAFFQAFMSQPKKQLKTFASWYISASTVQLQPRSNSFPSGPASAATSAFISTATTSTTTAGACRAWPAPSPSPPPQAPASPAPLSAAIAPTASRSWCSGVTTRAGPLAWRCIQPRGLQAPAMCTGKSSLSRAWWLCITLRTQSAALFL
jgi:hypothetical protein